MIQNKKITEKVAQKTLTDVQLREFINNILERESEGKHFREYYREQIAKISKDRRG